MKFTNILIRSIPYLDRRGADVKYALIHANSNKIPIYYQYAQSKQPEMHLPGTNIVGYASNIHVENNLLVCDVDILDLLRLASNFDGTIDNFVLSVNKSSDEHLYKLEHFIIYDKELKRKVEMRMSENEMKLEELRKSQEDSMKICMEIAGAESIEELNYHAPDAIEHS